MAVIDTVLDFIGRRIAERLEVPVIGCEPFAPSDPEILSRILQPADVLLVEGRQKLGTAIKYLTQSTWSHAALYAGDLLPESGDGCLLIEANLGEGVVAVPLRKYRSFNTRISPPLPFTEQQTKHVLGFAGLRLLQEPRGVSPDLVHPTLPWPLSVG